MPPWLHIPSSLAAGVMLLLATGILLGSYTVTIPDFFKILAAHVTGGEKIPGASFIVMEAKLPRAVTGTLIGLAFGLSGALFQTMLRNPLASPDVIGISYGASAAAVLAIVVFGASGGCVRGCPGRRDGRGGPDLRHRPRRLPGHRRRQPGQRGR